MTFLPIVERELRLAARRRSTFWLRLVAVTVAVLIGCGVLAISFAQSPVQMGTALFGTLTWLSFLAVCAAGLFFTADCLSEEKREGTLGLLFLTDLRGHDVVLGKLFATSLKTFYALFAILPVLGVALLLGGVTGGEFWRKSLALGNALFFSLAAGMFVSALSRDAHRAMSGSVLVMLGFLALLPIGDGALSNWQNAGFTPRLSFVSPGFNFVVAGQPRTASFWGSLAGSHLVGWLFLIAAAWLAARTWQERSRRGGAAYGGWHHRWQFGSGPFRAARRRKLLDRNPVLWLVFRQRWQGFFAWVLAVPLAAATIWVLVEDSSHEVAGFLGSFVVGIVVFIFDLWVVSQASRFFVEARRSGSIELLLASPLTAQEITRGQWLALRRIFALPVVLLVFVRMVMAFLQFGAYSGTMTFGGNVSPAFAAYLLAAITAPLIMVADLLALGWVGMWMGLTSRNVNFATLKTIVFVLVVPWFVGSFLSAIVMGLVAATTGAFASAPGSVFWISQVIVAAFYIAKDVFFVWLARRKVVADFREVAARSVMPVRLAPPRVSPLANAPPVIQSP